MLNANFFKLEIKINIQESGAMLEAMTPKNETCARAV